MPWPNRTNESAWATTERYDLSGTPRRWLEARVLEVFPIRQGSADRFGLAGIEQAEVRLDNSDFLISERSADLMGQKVDVKHVIEWTDSYGVIIGTKDFSRSLRITSIEFEPAVAILRCVDPGVTALATLYPSGTWQARNFPDIYPDHEGMVIPEIAGFGVGVNCAFLGELSENGTSYWRYGVCVIRLNQLLNVATILRNGREAATYDSGDRTFKDDSGNILAYPTVVSINGIGHYCLDFVLDQTQYGGGDPHPISAIIESTGEGGLGQDRNPVWELRRILEWADISIDATSFNEAEAYCDDQGLKVDYAYRDQRRIDAIAEELLYIARATLSPSDNGDLVIIQDKPAIIDDSTLFYDVMAGDAAEVTSVSRNEAPIAVEIKYAPWFLNPEVEAVNRNGFGGSLRRNISSGTGPVYRLRDLQMVREWTVADRIAAYWETRLSMSDTAQAMVQMPIVNDVPQFIGLGDIVGIGNCSVYPNKRYWRVVGVETGANNQNLSLELYSDEKFAYLPSEQPPTLITPRERRDRNTRWVGEYDEDLNEPYAKGSIVREGAYLMVANKQTWDRPAPIAVGEKIWILDGVILTERQITDTQIIRGVRITASEPVWVGDIAVILSANDDNQVYEFWEVKDSLGDPKATLIFSFDGTIADGRVPIPHGLDILPAGVSNDYLLIISRNNLGYTDSSAQYDYVIANGTATPGTIFHHNAGGGRTMSIHFTPQSGSDQGAFLQAMVPGDQIIVTQQTWTILSVVDVTASTIEFEVSPTTQIASGNYNFTFRSFSPAPLLYEGEDNRWLGNINIQGLEGTQYDSMTEVDTAFAVDVQLQSLKASPDYDFMAMSNF